LKLSFNFLKKIKSDNKYYIIKRISVILSIFTLIIVSSILPIYAHGAYIEYEADSSYTIEAKYDNGEPMSEAQVTIYAPDNPTVPYTTGICDENGKYVFLPDNSIKGSWLIQVRKAGHGASVHIEVGHSNSDYGNTGYTVLQKIIMTLCVIWGSIGTALYFKRGKRYARS